MQQKYRNLLIIDGIINLILGLLLLLFPLGIAKIMGVPEAAVNFYPSLLGAIIFAIGLALFMEVYGERSNIRGLGLGGAIVINLIGAGALIVWLLVSPFDLPLRGYIILWSIGFIVMLVGFIELMTKSWKYN
jgi:hypothetical protein